MKFSIPDRSLGVFELIVFVLSIYALGALLLDTFVPLTPESSRLIELFDFVLCGVFFTDFLVQLYRAESKLQYLKVGWIDLLASIPMIDALRFGRLFRVLRILRILRAIRGTQKIYLLLRQRKTMGGSVGLVAFMLITACSVSILGVETGERSNIQTATDALWWSLVTVTTVGYGDLYPVTPAGRVIAAILMVGGVGLFGSLTALVTSFFAAREAETPEHPLLAEIQSLRAEVQALRKQLE